MKYIKMLSLVLAASIVLGSFAGCAASKEPDVTTAGSSEVVTTTETPATSGSSATSEETTADPNYIRLFSEAQEYANMFISGFAANDLGDFDSDKMSVEKLLAFAFAYLKNNTDESIGYKKKGEVSYQTVTFAQTLKTIGQLFGTGLKEDDCKALPKPPTKYGENVEGPYYEDGKIWFFASDGDEQNTVAIVDSAYNNGDGTLTLNFTIYSIDIKTYLNLDNEEIKAYYKLTPEQAKADKTLKKICTGTATVGVGQSGEYILRSYKTTE